MFADGWVHITSLSLALKRLFLTRDLAVTELVTIKIDYLIRGLSLEIPARSSLSDLVVLECLLA